MNVKEQLNGIQHIGIPTNNIEATVHFYEKMGFEETDVVDEQDCHEVNMAYYI